jgi:hypothetical protein
MEAVIAGFLFIVVVELGILIGLIMTLIRTVASK